MKKRIFCVPQSLSKIGVVVFLKHFPNREISEKNKRKNLGKYFGKYFEIKGYFVCLKFSPKLV